MTNMMKKKAAAFVSYSDCPQVEGFSPCLLFQGVFNR
jgi:hypothetical protein